VDGHPLNVAQGGGVDLGALDVQGLERIEVSRGAVGALYGPYAMGGAINLVRRRDRASQASLRVQAGTEERAFLRAGYAWTGGRWSGDLFFRGETASPDLGTLRGSGQEAGGGARLAYHPTWASEVELLVEHRRDRRAVPGTRAFPSPEAERTDIANELSLSARGVSVAGLGGQWEAGARAVTFTRGYTDPAYGLGPVNDRHTNRSLQTTLEWERREAWGAVTARGEGTLDELESTMDGAQRRPRGALALQAERGVGRWSAAAVARLDAVQGFGTTPSVRASLTRVLVGGPQAPALTARVGAGTSFRPPTFDDLFWPARASAAGNPDLHPERSLDVDLGVGLAAGGARLDVSAFQARVSDLIQWSPGPDGVWRPHNLLQATLQGVEAEGTVPLPGLPFTLQGSGSWLDARDRTGDRLTGGKQLVGRSRFLGFGELQWVGGPWTAAVGARAVSAIPVTAVNTKWLDGYAVAHARLAWTVAPPLRLDVEARNLLDTSYEDVRGYATPGRELLLGLTYVEGGIEP